MNPWKIILATVLIFAAGVLTGGVLIHKFDRAGIARRQSAQKVQGPAARSRLDLLRRMERELDLTAEQRQKIDRILIASQERSRKLMEPIAPELREEVQRAKAEFREVLTPSQQTAFDALLKKQQQQRSHDPHRTHEQPKDKPVP